MPRVEIVPGPRELARAAAERLSDLAEKAIADRNRFAVALAGGSTPESAYALLAGEEFSRRVDWSRVHLFWGDERCVPPDHPDSNYGMVRRVLLDHLPIPDRNIHRMLGELDPPTAARTYELELRRFFMAGPRGQEGSPPPQGSSPPDPPPRGSSPQPQNPSPPFPRFDLILLGLGGDGHTASLFPGSRALEEAQRWVTADQVERLGAWRLTLTRRVINAARQILFLVSGGAKAGILRRVLSTAGRTGGLPAGTVRPADGQLGWLVDRAAAKLL